MQEEDNLDRDGLHHDLRPELLLHVGCQSKQAPQSVGVVRGVGAEDEG